MVLLPGIDFFVRSDDGLAMMPANFADGIEVDPGMTRRIALEIRQRQREQARGGSEPLLLQMDEAARHLDESLVKSGLRLAANRKPDFLQHVVGFVVELRV